MGGGGIGVYVHDHYSVNILASSDTLYANKPEYLILEIDISYTKLRFAVIYPRPHAAYLFSFFKCLSAYLLHFTSVIVTGDFNMNMATPNSPPAVSLQNLLDSHSLFLVPSDPTHHQLYRDSHTWLDLFIVKNAESVVAYHKSPAPFIAGHDFIYISLSHVKNPNRSLSQSSLAA